MNNLIKKILLILLYLMSIIFIYHIVTLNIFSAKYLTIIIPIIILLALLSLLILNKNKVVEIIFSILCILLSLFYLITSIYLSNTKDYIFKATSNDTTYKTYQVLVLKENNYTKIKDLNNKTIGFLNIDSHLELSVEKLKEKISLKETTYDDVSLLYSALQTKKVDAISIDENYLETLKEDNKELLNNTKVIYKYRIDINQNNKKNKEDKNITNKKPYILYISGSDSRTTVRAVSRSDVNIIAAVNPNTNKILLVHIPRDYYVQLHGTTGVKDKLTHAGVYGINKSITTIEDILDIKIDKYVKVSFATVIKSVDLLGGIDIYSEKSFTPWTNRKCHIVTGTQHLNGRCALAFARERRTYLTGDRHRGENQEQVLTKIIEKISNPQYLLKYNEILKKTSDSFETNMTYEEITSIVKEELDTLAKWNIESYNLDGVGDMQPTYSMGSMLLYVMQPDQSTIETAKQKIKEYLTEE